MVARRYVIGRRSLISRRSLVIGAVLTVLLAGCGSSHRTASPGASSGSQLGSAASTGSASTAPVTLPGSPLPSTPAPSQMSVPPYLCDATDQAQNAADAYMGALSAGNEKQAAACVLPGSVPAAVTHGLLAGTKGTAVYLPRDGFEGPAVFSYQGNGKSIDVTVTNRDGKFWVTKVAVR